MDTVGFRTLGCGAAHDTDLGGARTAERHGDHDIAGGYGAWGSHLGFGSTLLWAAVLFLGSLVLVRLLSINVVESKEVAPIALTEELVAA